MLEIPTHHYRIWSGGLHWEPTLIIISTLASESYIIHTVGSNIYSSKFPSSSIHISWIKQCNGKPFNSDPRAKQEQLIASSSYLPSTTPLLQWEQRMHQASSSHKGASHPQLNNHSPIQPPSPSHPSSTYTRFGSLLTLEFLCTSVSRFFFLKRSSRSRRSWRSFSRFQRVASSLACFLRASSVVGMVVVGWEVSWEVKWSGVEWDEMTVDCGLKWSEAKMWWRFGCCFAYGWSWGLGWSGVRQNCWLFELVDCGKLWCIVWMSECVCWLSVSEIRKREESIAKNQIPSFYTHPSAQEILHFLEAFITPTSQSHISHNTHNPLVPHP